MLSGDTARPYLTEGVGEDFLPGTYDPSVVDRWVRVSDRDAFAMARRLTREEGILSGGSCGTAMVAAREVVRDLTATDGGGRGRRRPPAGQRPELPLQGLQRRVDAGQRPDGHDRRCRPDRGLLADRHHARPPRRGGRTTERVGDAIATLQTYGISQLPVSEGPEGDDVVGLVGSINEKGCSIGRIATRRGGADRRRGHGPAATAGRGVRRPSMRRSRCQGRRRAVVAVRGGRPVGIVTKLDLLEYLAHNRAATG